MGFADGYLQKHTQEKPNIQDPPDSELKSIITIPAYNESRLLKCLDSLYKMDKAPFSAEVLILINTSAKSPPEEVRENDAIFLQAQNWAQTKQRDNLQFRFIRRKDLPPKHFGAGLARKIVMDEAIYRFNLIDNGAGIILSLDADTTVEPDYLNAVTSRLLTDEQADGCTVCFEHPTSGNEFPEEVYQAIINYELHQRYYLQGIRYTGFPHAFHTVGSCFAIKAKSYCRMGGMSKRQAGEDFYFIQKVALNGNFRECNTTCVHPSPRPSHRVPFGTGPDISRQLSSPGQPYLTYHPALFKQLKQFFQSIPFFYHGKPHSKFHPVLNTYLDESGFSNALDEIRSNVAGESTFRQRFFMNFNMFWILKYLHFALENNIPKVPIEKAAVEMLEFIGEIPEQTDKKSLLMTYRRLELKDWI